MLCFACQSGPRRVSRNTSELSDWWHSVTYGPSWAVKYIKSGLNEHTHNLSCLVCRVIHLPAPWFCYAVKLTSNPLPVSLLATLRSFLIVASGEQTCGSGTQWGGWHKVLEGKVISWGIFELRYENLRFYQAETFLTKSLLKIFSPFHSAPFQQDLAENIKCFPKQFFLSHISIWWRDNRRHRRRLNGRQNLEGDQTNTLSVIFKQTNQFYLDNFWLVREATWATPHQLHCCLIAMCCRI